MAPGPVPKPASQRARRNVPARGEWQDLTPIEDLVLPPLPELDGAAWNARTVRMWDGLRHDPATALFGESEIALAIEAAFIHARAVADKNDSMLKTALGLLDKLGLTPKGKRDLRLRVSNEQAAVTPLKLVARPRVERPA